MPAATNLGKNERTNGILRRSGKAIVLVYQEHLKIYIHIIRSSWPKHPPELPFAQRVYVKDALTPTVVQHAEHAKCTVMQLMPQCVLRSGKDRVVLVPVSGTYPDMRGHVLSSDQGQDLAHFGLVW